MEAAVVAIRQYNILIYNKLYASNTNECPAKRVEKHISKNRTLVKIRYSNVSNL